jgi:hypothetical protein
MKFKIRSGSIFAFSAAARQKLDELQPARTVGIGADGNPVYSSTGQLNESMLIACRSGWPVS